MTQPVFTVGSKDSLGMAAARMAKMGIKRLPVIDENGRLVGVLSRVDILRLVADKEARKQVIPSGAAISVRDVMSASMPVVREEDDLAKIVDTLLEGGAHRVIVTNKKGYPVGLISDSDVVARIQAADQSAVLAALQGESKPPSIKVTAYELMSPGVLTAKPETTIVDAIKMMMSPKRKWLVVVDEKNQPLGLVDRQILLRALSIR